MTDPSSDDRLIGVDGGENMVQVVRQMQEQLSAVQADNKGLQKRVEDLEAASITRPSSEERWKRLRKSFQDTYEVSEDPSAAASEDSSDILASRMAPLVFMHPEEVISMRPYTPEELQRVKRRPFPSRLFISNAQIEWNAVWLRTRHTDHHAKRFNQVFLMRAFKADSITNKPHVTKQLMALAVFNASEGGDSGYYSFACTLASAFSEGGSNLEFEKDLLFGSSDFEITHRMFEAEQERARRRVIQLMDIYFFTVKRKGILMDDGNQNIYRIGHCLQYSQYQWSNYLISVFAFLFQILSFAYTAVSLTSLEGDSAVLEVNVALWTQNMPLALGALGYSIMVALTQMENAKEAFWCCYRSQLSLFAVMDLTINLFFPLPVALFGFFLVLEAERCLDAVLNAVALLFITQLDEEMTLFLGLDNQRVVQRFIIDSAMDDYDTQNLDQDIAPIEFTDMHITNTEESGSLPRRGVTFQPHRVLGPSDGAGKKQRQKYSKSERQARDIGNKVIGTRSVTQHCLLRKIEWQYTSWHDGTCQPRIGHLKLHKLLDGNVVEIVGKQKEQDESKKPFFSVTGVYIITSYLEAEDVLRLRICGSQTPQSFLAAFEYYNLWAIDSTATNLLEAVRIDPTEKEVEATKEVLYGTDEHRASKEKKE